MIDLLAKQNEHLQTIVNLMKTDRLMQLAQTYGIKEIDKEDNKATETLGEISSDIKSSIKQENLHYNAEHSIITDYRKEDVKEQEKLNKHNDDIAKKHLEALKNIQKGIEKNGFRDIADKAKGEPVHTTFKEDWGNLKDKFSSMKDKVKGVTVGGVLKGAKDTILSTVSPRYADKLDYIRNEKNLDNKKTDKELEQDYDQRSKALQANKENERELLKRKGSLTEEEYLKGNKDWAPTYLENKAKIGETLKQTDSRYRLDDIKETHAMKEETPLKKSVNNIAEVATEQAGSIPPMMTSNISAEDEIEANRATKLYQDTQLEHSKTQNETLTKQLEVQKTILELLKSKLKDSESSETDGTDGIGLPDIDLGRNKPTGRIRGKSKRAQNKGTIKSRRTQARRTKMTNAKGNIPKGIVPEVTPTAKGVSSVGDIVPEVKPSNGKGLLSESKTGVKEGAKKAITALGETALGKSVLGGVAKASKSVSPALSKTLESSKKVLGWLGKVPGLGTILTAADIYMRIDDLDEQVKNGTLPESEYKQEVTKAIGSALGSTGGALAGAALGTFAGGPIGMVLGGIGGAIGGEHVGEMVADKLFDIVSSGEEPPITTPKTEKITPATTEQIKPEGYQPYTPKPEDAISTKIRPVITGNETEAELDAMNKALGYTVEDIKPTKPTKANPLTVVPRTADSIYNQSAETTSSSTPATAPVINNISAPNNTVNNSSSKSPMKVDIKNPESSVNNMFASRQRFL